MQHTQMKSSITPFHFSMFRERADSVVYDGGVAVYSNLDVDFHMDEDRVGQNCLPYPMRLMMLSVLVCRKGQLRVHCNLEDHTVEEGEVMVMLPGSTMDALICAEGTRACFISVTQDMAADMRPMFGRATDIQDFVRPVRLKISEEQILFLIQLIEMLRSCVAMPSPEERREAVASCGRILSCLFRQCQVPNEQPQDTGKHPRCHVIFTQFVRHVLQHYREHRNLQFYADLQYITPKYLGAAVMQASGRRAYDIICDQVILEAKLLLRTPGNTVQQVGFSLNFHNHSFFSKFFKAHTGLTPQQFMLGR